MIANVVIIPARAGSKRVPNKNIREFEGLPLVAFSIKLALASKSVQKVVVSTNDEKVANIAKEYGVEVFWRSQELSSDTASTFDVLKNVYNILLDQGYCPDYFTLLQPTSPLRKKELIDNGIQIITADPSATSLMSVYEQKVFTGHLNNGYWVPDFPEDTRSQDIPPKYVPTGNLYIYKCSETINKNDALGSKTIPLIEDGSKIVNIDYEEDFLNLEFVFSQNRDVFSYLT